MQRILIPLDGSPSSERAVKHVIALSKLGVPAEIHLLHVQPPVVAQDVPDIAKPGLMERLESTDAHHALDSAKRLLEEAGLRYSTRLDVGDPAELIVLYSKVMTATQSSWAHADWAASSSWRWARLPRKSCMR